MSDSTEQKSEWRERELGALWKRQPQNGGNTYLAGNLNGDGVVVFSNRNKGDNPKAPDYIVYRSKDMPQKPQEAQEAQQSQTDMVEDEEVL